MPKVNTNELRWLILEQGFSLNKLSKETQLSKATISRLLNNKCNARPSTISKIAKILEINPRKLYFED